MRKVDLARKFASFSDLWSPKVAGELNGQQVKLAKLHGEFVWHHHDDEDEMFFVLEGSLKILFRDKEVLLEKGEFLVVPRSVEHKPVADEPACVLLFEPATTRNTGNVDHEYTIEADDLDHI